MEWNRIYRAVLVAVYNERAHKAALKLEITVDAPTKAELKLKLQKRTAKMLSLDPIENEQSPPKGRYTRTDVFLERKRNRAEALANAGEFE